MRIVSRVVGVAALLGSMLVGGAGQAQECQPTCRAGYVCATGRCVSACNPPCALGESCSPQAECVSACNPACTGGEQCSPQGECVSNCNPPCASGELCTASGECQASTLAPAAPFAQAPGFAPGEPQPGATGGPASSAGRAGFLQAGALVGRFSYSGTYDSGASLEGSGMIVGVEAAGGVQLSPKFRVGAGLQFFSMPSPDGTVDGESQSPDTGKGGVVGVYLAWGGDSGLLIDGIAGYGGSGADSQFGGWGPGLFPGIGYQSSGPVRFSILGRAYVMPTSSESGESGTFSGFQVVAALGAY